MVFALLASLAVGAAAQPDTHGNPAATSVAPAAVQQDTRSDTGAARPVSPRRSRASASNPRQTAGGLLIPEPATAAFMAIAGLFTFSRRRPAKAR